MDAHQPVSTVRDLIDAMGGPAPFADAVGERSDTVRQWRQRNRLPAHKYLRHAAIFSARGLSVPPSLWNLAEAEVPK